MNRRKEGDEDVALRIPLRKRQCDQLCRGAGFEQPERQYTASRPAHRPSGSHSGRPVDPTLPIRALGIRNATPGAHPRPEAPRSPSSIRQVQSVSPVAASMAATARRIPAVASRTPSTIRRVAR